MLNVEINDNIIRKRLNKYILFRRVARKKSLLSKSNMAAQFRSVDIWNNVVWTDRTEVEMFDLNAQQHVW